MLKILFFPDFGVKKLISFLSDLMSGGFSDDITVLLNKTHKSRMFILVQHWLYSPFHKILPRSSFQMHLISVRFYELGDTSVRGDVQKKSGTFNGSVNNRPLTFFQIGSRV